VDAAAAFAAAERAFLDGDDAACERLAVEAGDLPAALRLRGLWRLRKGDPAAAIEFLARASAAAQDEPVFASDLGVARRLAGDSEGAVEEFRRATALDPGYAQAWHNLGLTLRALGDKPGASVALERACAVAPAALASRQALGMVRREAGDLPGAAAAFEAAAERAPEDAGALANLGRVRWELGDYAAAEALLSRALAIDPDLVAARRTLASLLFGLGDVEAALTEIEVCARLDPADAWVAQARASLENAAGRAGGARLRELAETWARLARPPAPRVHAARPRPAKLRVGWMSPDFRRHSCAFFLEAPLANRDRARFEAIAFANFTHKRRPDSTTAALRAHFDEWHDVSDDGEAALAACLEEARLDVLIDLAGFSADTRVELTLRKPAPVALAWLGYAGTTGAAEIGWRIGDAISDPPANDGHWTERMYRLDGPFLAYDPRGPAPDPATGRVPVPGGIVFGSFNVSSKLSIETLTVWARILAAEPGATLALKDNWRLKARARARQSAGGPSGAAARSRKVSRLPARRRRPSRNLRPYRRGPRSLSLQRHDHDVRSAVDGRARRDVGGNPARGPRGRFAADPCGLRRMGGARSGRLRAHRPRSRGRAIALARLARRDPSVIRRFAGVRSAGFRAAVRSRPRRAVGRFHAPCAKRRKPMM
jgi:predicted O-linked N-acetylglucosamine transferase (SPINDLY family)